MFWLPDLDRNSLPTFSNKHLSKKKKKKKNPSASCKTAYFFFKLCYGAAWEHILKVIQSLPPPPEKPRLVECTQFEDFVTAHNNAESLSMVCFGPTCPLWYSVYSEKFGFQLTLCQAAEAQAVTLEKHIFSTSTAGGT